MPSVRDNWSQCRSDTRANVNSLLGDLPLPRMTAPTDNHVMNAHRRGVLLTFTLVGVFLAIAGVSLRLVANPLSKRIVRSGYESDFAAWRDALGGCGTLIAAFGMLMILLTLHHYLLAPP